MVSNPSIGPSSIVEKIGIATPARPQTRTQALVFSPSELQLCSAIYTKSSKLPSRSYAPPSAPMRVEQPKGGI